MINKSLARRGARPRTTDQHGPRRTKHRVGALSRWGVDWFGDDRGHHKRRQPSRVLDTGPPAALSSCLTSMQCDPAKSCRKRMRALGSLCGTTRTAVTRAQRDDKQVSCPQSRKRQLNGASLQCAVCVVGDARITTPIVALLFLLRPPSAQKPDTGTGPSYWDLVRLVYAPSPKR
jgi:hypothetical protein